MKAFFDFQNNRFVNYIYNHFVVTDDPFVYDDEDPTEFDTDHEYPDVKVIDVIVLPKKKSIRKNYEDGKIIDSH
jgi:hypothetical protein